MAADYKTLIGIVKDLADLANVTESIPEALAQRAREALEPSKPKNDPDVLHFQLPDDCCSKPFQKAASSGHLDKADYWTCPKCGGLWKATIVDGARRWISQPAAMVFKL